MSVKSKQHPILLILAVAMVGIYLGDLIILSPMVALWKGRSEKIETLRKNISDGQILIANESRYRQRIQDIIDASLPMDYSAAGDMMFKEFEEWRSASGFSVTDYRPRQVGRSNEKIRLEVETSGYGDKESVWRYLYEIESCPLALAVEEITIQSPNEKGDRLNLTVKFSGLLLKQTP